MTGLRDRSTGDLVVLILAVTVGVVFVVAVVMLGIVVVRHPELTGSGAATGVLTTMTTLAGAMIGYVAGRRTNGYPKG